MRLGDLTPNPQNPRRISDEKLEMLRKSLAEFGDLSGIVYNRRSGQLVGGHQRTKVLPPDAEIVLEYTLDKPTTTGTVAEGYVIIDGERFKYREVDWADLKEKSANVAANQHGGDFDLPKLSEWLIELDAHNIDMDLVGFTAEELENLIVPVEKVEPEDENGGVGTPPKEPKTRKGDIYRLGQHRLMCGDSTAIDDVNRLMAGQLADMVWTDPPYNVAYQGKTAESLTIENDSMDDESFYKFLYDFYVSALTATKPGGAIYVAHADSEGANFRRAMKDAGWLLKQCLVWVKNSLVMGRQDYHWKHEPILYGWAPGDSHNWYSDRTQTTVLEFDRPTRNGEHPTMKPVELVQYMIGNSSLRKQIVLDLFGGSGTTLIACENLGRCGYLMELDPAYCDVIVNRWEKLTGQKAELVDA